MRYVLDASAVLALLQNEQGIEKVQEALEQEAMMSTVNVAEVVTKLTQRGLTIEEVSLALENLAIVLLDFDEQQAIHTGDMVRQTAGKGLSLGDRACLVLAMQLAATVLTTDRVWKALKIPVLIEIIR
jgi:PIN domain nuclease of toxin-antitoxin system